MSRVNKNPSWSWEETRLALDPKISVAKLMKLTGRTESAVRWHRWELDCLRAHHDLMAPCHCFCRKIQTHHCPGGEAHSLFVKANAPLGQKTLFDL